MWRPKLSLLALLFLLGALLLAMGTPENLAPPALAANETAPSLNGQPLPTLTVIESFPTTVERGETFTVSGRVLAAEDLSSLRATEGEGLRGAANVTVHVYVHTSAPFWFLKLGEAKADSQGYFVVEATVPATARAAGGPVPFPPGNHTLYAKAIGDEKYSPSWSFPQKVAVKIPTAIILNEPEWAANDVSISGRVLDDLGRPVAGVDVRVWLNGVTARSTQSDQNGLFSLKLASESAPMPLRVSVESGETREYRASSSTAVFAPPGQTAPLMAFLSPEFLAGLGLGSILSIAAYRLYAKHSHLRSASKGGVNPRPKGENSRRDEAGRPLQGLRAGDLLQASPASNVEKSPAETVKLAYGSVRRLLESAEVSPSRGRTPREFLDAVRRREPEIAEPLKELTLLFEAATYSGRGVQVKDAQAALSLAEQIRVMFEAKIERSSSTPP